MSIMTAPSRPATSVSQPPDERGAELVRLRGQLVEAQRLAVIGRLAGGIAHDFNNIISASLIHLNLLQQDPDFSAAQRESLGNLERETARGASLTRQLMAFGRRDEGDLLKSFWIVNVIFDCFAHIRTSYISNYRTVFG
jgi:signal transduction histidine kinase